MRLNPRTLRGLAGVACAAVLLAADPAPQVPVTSCSGIVIAENAARAPKKITPAVPNAAAAGSIPTGADSSLVEELKKGGYILYFRHALTNWNERDATEGDFADRARQRNLSEAGQREATLIGESIKVLEIPIEKVLASPMWRCRDTAEFAFGQYDTTGLLFWKGASFREAE